MCNTTKVIYRFGLPDGRTEEYELEIDSRKLILLNQSVENAPEWTKLEFRQCPNCPLKKEESPCCPVALNLVGLVEGFVRIISYDTVHVDVEMPERRVTQDTSAQRAVSSIMGLIMATSGCPLTAFFRPMARFHLPFSNREDTVFRAASMYLLAQYFVVAGGEKGDWSLAGLKELYAEIHRMNGALANRFRAVIESDALLNAIVRLDQFAEVMTRAIDGSLADISYLFDDYPAR